MVLQRPIVILLAGPNGAGKTTASRKLLPLFLEQPEYVDADAIARGLSPFAPETAAISAGKLAIRRREELARKRTDFAFESTISSPRSPAEFLRRLQADGYLVNIAFLWLRSPELSVTRVATRVAAGGHDIPLDDLLRRFYRTIDNFMSIYRPLADRWSVWDNSGSELALVAFGAIEAPTVVVDSGAWDEFRQQAQKRRGDA